MIKLVENNSEARLVLEHLSSEAAPLLAAKMFTEGFGVKQDFLQFYAAFNDSGRLCAAFVRCNDRVFCLIDSLYDKDEILLFLKGFKDYKIFIGSNFSHIMQIPGFKTHFLMKKYGKPEISLIKPKQIESKAFTDIIAKDKDKDYKVRFLLNNSHLVRHGYLVNYANIHNGEICSIASVYDTSEASYLCNVFTPKCYRHRGFASDLVKRITKGQKEYHLICGEDVSALYLKCGFEVYSRWLEFLF